MSLQDEAAPEWQRWPVKRLLLLCLPALVWLINHTDFQGALSALPAGLGGMELVFAGLLIAQSASTAEALTITVVARLLTLWLAVGIGVAALLYSACVAKDIRF